MRHGFIYVLQNRDLRANLLKIGKTTKKPKERAKEISSATGVLQPFEVVWEEAVRDCDLAEQLVHRKLESYRVASNREFFELPLKDAIEVVQEAAAEIGPLNGVEGDANTEALVDPINQESRDRSKDAEIDFKVPEVTRNATRSAPQAASLESHLNRADEERRKIFLEIRDRILAMDDRIQENVRTRRIGYRLGNDFAVVIIQKKRLFVKIRDTGYCGSSGLIQRVPNKPGYEIWSLKATLYLEKRGQIDEAIEAIKLSYDDVARRL